MASASINQDSFLQSQGIEVEGSDFLKKILEKKEKGIKEEYNLLDVHGRRLSRYWQPGDTLFSVASKKVRFRMRMALDPDTYSYESYQEMREYLIRQKVKLLGICLTLVLPLSLYYHGFRPRINRIKRLYTMQFYNKMSFFSRELGIKTKPIAHKDLENTL